MHSFYKTECNLCRIFSSEYAYIFDFSSEFAYMYATEVLSCDQDNVKLRDKTLVANCCGCCWLIVTSAFGMEAKFGLNFLQQPHTLASPKVIITKAITKLINLWLAAGCEAKVATKYVYTDYYYAFSYPLQDNTEILQSCIIGILHTSCGINFFVITELRVIA